jgi:AcrR family transcriptional regulator
MVTKQNIIDAAFRLFASKGFHETTTENIAKSLGIKKQSLYSHFNSKNDIIYAVLQEQGSHINNEIDTIIAEHRNKPVDMLLKFIFIRITLFFSQRDRLLLWKRIFHLEIHGEFSEIFHIPDWQFDRKLRAELHDIIGSRYQLYDNPEKIRSFFLSYMLFVHGYLDWMLIAGYDMNTAESTWNIFWNGMKSVL